MEEVNERNWMRDYDALMTKIKQKRINGDPFSGAEIQSINDIVERLNLQLKTMGRDPLQYELVNSEIARRTVLMDNIKRLTTIIKANIIPDANPARPTAYLSASDGRNSTTNPMVTDDHRGKALMQRQEEVIKMQDEMISDIESGVDRLHGQAVVMGEELQGQVKIIDSLDHKVDVTTTALQEETRHAQEIKDKGKVCGLYICIAIEVVVLILLLILAYGTSQ